ncbi:hypothetical protein KIN20_030785 [Parelaphostrongylus tenuis]|uniref:Lipoprotein n=1 Tax=Parelaphostrongylus tenuis TaxID=148309 RepID=A0AAD5R4P8_PARTN|nr:hypothetical protein KIN20_030785 [Parelaphostrongylus tenuis]
MARIPKTCLFTTSLLTTISTTLGCGVMPPGQAITRNFTVSGFTLPVTMVYSGEISVRARVSGIASSKETAMASVSRLLMQTVFDALEQQGRRALLPDAVISDILGQLRVQINYDPLECQGATIVVNAATMRRRMVL